MHGGAGEATNSGTFHGLPHQPSPAITGHSGAEQFLSGLPMGDQGHQGDFGEMFVEALAVAANLDIQKPGRRDRIGLDWTINYPGRGGTIGFPAINAQVKSWSKPKGNDAEFRYPLEIKNFNMLAGSAYQIPRFLFLVVVPTDPSDWIDVDKTRLLLRHAAYWACFHGDEPILDENRQSSTHTVPVPRANLLSVESLHGLFAPSFRNMLVAK